MRSPAVFLIFLLLAPPASFTAGVKVEQASPDSIYFPTYLERDFSGGSIRFSVSAAFGDLNVVSSSRMRPDRDLLLIFNPGLHSRPEIRGRVAAVTEAVLAALRKRPQLRVRIGVPVLDGILLDEPIRAGLSPRSVVDAVMQLISDPSMEQGGSPGRVLDLVGSLMQRAETAGDSLDCLLIGKDVTFGGEDGEHLRLGVERRILEICGRRGSTLHGYLEGNGSLGSICAATGGSAWGGADQAVAVIAGLLGARDRAYIVEVRKPSAQVRARLTLAIRVEGGAETIGVRAPAAVWQSPDAAAAPDSSSANEALDWIRRAQNAAEGRDFRTAVRFIENGLQSDPWNPNVSYYGALYSYELGDFVMAADFLAKAMQFIAPSERVYVLFGEVSRKTGKAEQALKTIQSLPAEEVRSPLLRLTVARLLSTLGRMEEAGRLYAQLPVEVMKDGQIRAEYGCLLWDLGKKESAGEQLRSALAADSRNITAMLCSADMAVSVGRMQEALDEVSRAAVLQPENPDVHARLGRIHAQARRWEQALESSETAARLAPARSDLQLQLAEVEIQSGQGREAVETIRRLLGINPSDVTAYQRAAELYARSASFAPAASLLEEGAAKFPQKSGEFYETAAGLRERTGQYGQALLDYRALIQSAPPDKATQLRREMSAHLEYLAVMLRNTTRRLGGDAGPTSLKGADALSAGQSILVPGGLPMLGNMLGLNARALALPGAAGRLFSLILELPAQGKGGGAKNPIQSEMALQFDFYQRLLRHMRSKGLLPADFDREKGQQFVFPLAGDKAAVIPAKRFLSFFGVRHKLVLKDGKTTVTLRFSQDSVSQARLQLLRCLGIDIHDKNIRVLRFRMGDGKLPSILSARVIQDKLLGLAQIPSEALLIKLILRPDAMRLYLALEDCPARLRDTLVSGGFSARELAGLTPVLEKFGRFLDFDGKPVLPGNPQTWETLVGTPSTGSSFLRSFLQHGNGKLMYACFALEFAAPAVQRYFTSSPRLLEGFSNLVSPPGLGDARSTWQPEATRIVRLLSADEQGLFLPIDQRFGPFLFPGRPKAGKSSAGPGFARLRLGPEDLGSLCRAGVKSGTDPVRCSASFIEFLVYLQNAKPGLLTDAFIEAMMRNPAESPLFLDLIWNTDPPADLLVDYFAYCRELAAAGNTDWNVNRTRTSQSVFTLISALCRETVISKETAREMLREALSAFATAREEQAFLLNTVRLLTGILLPELGRSLGQPADAPGLLLRALAGREHPEYFLYDGSPLVQEQSAVRLVRMRAALQQQRLTPLPELLDMIQLTQKILLSPRWEPELLAMLAGRLMELPLPGPPAMPAGSGK